MNTKFSEELKKDGISNELKKVADEIVTSALQAYWTQYRKMLESVGTVPRIPPFGEWDENQLMLHKACMMTALLAAKDILSSVETCDHGVVLSKPCAECAEWSRQNPAGFKTQ